MERPTELIKFSNQEFKKLIEQHENLTLFHEEISLDLEHIFIGAKSVASPFLKPDTTGNVGIGAYTLEGLGVGVSFLPLVLPPAEAFTPIIGAIISFIGKGLHFIDNKQEKKKITKIAKLGSLEELNKDILEVSQTLTWQYQNQIKELSKGSVRKVAEFAILRMLEFLCSDSRKQFISLSVELINAVKCPSPFLDSATTTILKGVGLIGLENKNNNKWFLSEFFNKPWIKTEEGELFTDGNVYNCYGFRWGTELEAQQYNLKKEEKKNSVVQISDSIDEILPPINNNISIDPLPKNIEQKEKQPDQTTIVSNDVTLSIIKLDLQSKKIDDHQLVNLAMTHSKKKEQQYTEIDLSNNKITDGSIKALLELIKVYQGSLQVLNISNNNIHFLGFIRLLYGLKEQDIKLKKLSFSKNKIIISSEIADEIKESGIISCEEIDCSFNNFKSENIRVLKCILKLFNNIKILNIDGNRFGNHGILQLTEFLKELNLNKLLLSQNDIGDDGISNLCNSFLLKNSSLIEIDLSCNKITASGANALVETLKENRVLSILRLSKNNLGDYGLKSLAKGLKHNNALIEVNLDYNDIGDRGALFLRSGLRNHPSISRISLAYNDIGDQGAKFLAEIFNEFTHLDISLNSIKADGATEIAKSLYHNQTIKSINLAGNKIGNQGVEYLAERLKSNHSLESINLACNQFDTEVIEPLVGLYDKNNIKIEVTHYEPGYDILEGHDLSMMCLMGSI